MSLPLFCMNRIDRLTSMILMLQSHRVVTADKIAGHFEISVRTVYRDIAALGEAGVPIVAEAGIGYSLMRGYNVPPIMFTQSEIAALFMSGEITEQFGDDSLKKSLSEALLKVRSVLPEGHKNYLNKLGDRMEVWGRPNAGKMGISLMPMQEAVVGRRCILIEYDTGGRGEVSKRTVEALGLTYYARQWHLIAWCRMRGAIRDFRLDRMKSWEVLAETFEGHSDFSLAEFLKCVVDEGELVSIRLECEAWALDRVMHDSPCQFTSKEALPNGRFLVDAKALSLDWLTGWLVGMGTSVCVREPAALKERVLGELQKIKDLYQS